MKVSIITATYNSAATVADTIRSVQQQTYGNIEHIIVDGASKDTTLDIVRKMHAGIIVSEKDKGIYDAMNKGIGMATGDIIGILNSDDYYADKHRIEKIVALIESTKADALYGDLLYVDANDESIVKRKWIAGKYTVRSFLFGWMPPHPTFFVRKHVYEKYGLFNLNLGSAADYELMLRLLYKHKIKAAYLPEVIVKMRTGGVSNKTLQNRIAANVNDRLAWKVNEIKPYPFTLFCKPLRKLIQFV
jgi:glycosyltransferase